MANVGDDDTQRSEDTVDALRLFGKSQDSGGNSDRSGDSDSAIIDKVPDSTMYHYKMDYPCMGTCLIINNKNFHKSTNMGVRNGTDVDAAAAMKTFSELGYKIKVASDQTVAQMKSLMCSVAKDDHSNSASFVCVMLSHGEEGVVYGIDGAEKFESLTKPFKGNSCRTLVGKPKLFFIQACRGSELDEGALVETDSKEETSERIPVEADFLYAFSTAPGYYSWRNTQNGSWFMQAVCEMLQRHRGEMELMQIMTRVNHKVATSFESCSSLPGYNGKKQIPCIVSMLTKEVHFPN